MTCENIILLLIQLSVAIILFFTYIAVKKYVGATIKLWEETAKQTKEMVKQTGATIRQTRLSMRPIVIITYDERDRKFKFKNYGNTPAFSITMDNVSPTEGIEYIFDEVYFLPQSNKINLIIKKKINGDISETNSFDRGAIIPPGAQRTFDVIIRYKNAEKEKFTTEGKLGEGTFDITRIE